jgi:hypothetical protein
MNLVVRTALLFLIPTLASAAPLTIDLTTPVAPPSAPPYGPGTATSPDGHTITADSYSMLMDGKRWTPVAGEFHYSRYPRAEWREELLKMKAGGITVVSTYVFWIHQEEEQGKFDWSGQRSLRDFLLLCKELGLKVFVRMGPWCHGEVRNGGLPDWVQNSGAKLRSTDPKFLDLVKPLYAAEAEQMKGLLWKDGGPVIGVQMDNENGNAPYLRALKAMAQADGVDVPYYAMTGWDIKVLDKDFLLLFGAYFDGFWGGTLEKYRRDFLFTNVRASNNLGAQMEDRAPGNSGNIDKFPFLCVEIGPGMMSSYAKRIKVDPEAVTAMALIKMGEGSNMPGYYMYQGGMNPDGKLSTLEETHPNFMPLKDYDFQTCLGACGQVRPQFHMLYEQHLFLQDFGPLLATMPAYFPDQKPAGVDDFDTLRWDVRTNGTTGFLFFSNEQPYVPLPEHKGVQFQLKTAGGTQLIPREPITIPSGSYGFWPVNLDCDGVTVDYATAQPLCRVVGNGGGATYFFAALNGVPAELAIHPGEPGAGIHKFAADSDGLYSVTKPDGKVVTFAILTPDESRHLARAKFAGRDRLFMSNGTVFTDGASLIVQGEDPRDMDVLCYPPTAHLNDSSILRSQGLFDGIPYLGAPQGFGAPLVVTVSQVQPASADLVPLTGSNEATWDGAAVYKLNIPPVAANRRVIMNIHYIGDAARLYIGDKLYDDNFYNGDPFAIALWRIPADQWPNLRLKVIPYSDALLARLPAQAKEAAAAAKAAGTLDQVTVTCADQLEFVVKVAKYYSK